MKIDENNPKHIIAEEGYLLKRTRDNFVFGFEVFLGGDDTIEDFEEIVESEIDGENEEPNEIEQPN